MILGVIYLSVEITIHEEKAEDACGGENLNDLLTVNFTTLANPHHQEQIEVNTFSRPFYVVSYLNFRVSGCVRLRVFYSRPHR